MNELIRRDQKKAFWGIPSEDGKPVFQRMKYFTELSGSKNPGEYNRRYVDENFQRSDVTSYSTSWSFNFDEYKITILKENYLRILLKSRKEIMIYCL